MTYSATDTAVGLTAPTKLSHFTTAHLCSLDILQTVRTESVTDNTGSGILSPSLENKLLVTLKEKKKLDFASFPLTSAHYSVPLTLQSVWGIEFWLTWLGWLTACLAV